MAKLRSTHLWDADLTGARMDGADLSEADLRHTKLTDTDLTRAAFDRARCAGTLFVDADLSDACGLTTIHHDGPSPISIGTLFKTKGALPNAFLRGAGVPDIFIQYAAALSGKALAFYSAFISYSSRDKVFAERLHADLRSHGVRCWFAPEDLKIGDKTRPTIDQSIRAYDKLLIVLSKHSVASDWVEHEVETAIAREQEQRRTMLFPIRLDDTVIESNTGWPSHVKNTRHIGDFRNWQNHDAYQKSLARLLRDLGASETSKQ